MLKLVFPAVAALVVASGCTKSSPEAVSPATTTAPDTRSREQIKAEHAKVFHHCSAQKLGALWCGCMAHKVGVLRHTQASAASACDTEVPRTDPEQVAHTPPKGPPDVPSDTSPQDSESTIEEPAQPPRPPVDPESYRSGEGYGKARWGMTRRQVRKETKLKSKNDLVVARVVGHPAQTLYRYLDLDRLESVIVTFTQRLSSEQHMARYKALAARLTTKYGKPDHQKIETKEDKENEKMFGTWLSLGSLRFQSQWSTASSTILLDLKSEGIGSNNIKLQITYSSTALEPIGRAEREAKELQDL